jgi:hypothetical protein
MFSGCECLVRVGEVKPEQHPSRRPPWTKILLDELRGLTDIGRVGVNVPTDYLVPEPSFVTGAGSCFNLAGGYFIYNSHPTPAEADASAIRRDWLKVAQDFRTALERYQLEGSRESR